MSQTNPPNHHIVTSTQHFQDLLSADLDKVSLISFWAPWADPCKQMNEVVLELAKKHPTALFLQVEAEEQSDIADSFDIESVPSLLLLRGHTLLDKIVGADSARVSASLEKHTSRPAIVPLSSTDQSPAKASSLPDSSAPNNETPEELEKRMRGLMNQSRVVLFMKGNPSQPRCGFSRKIVGLLHDKAVEFSSFDILEDEAVRQGLKKLNDWPTFPQLIVNGEFVGGLDIVQEMLENGEFDEVVKSG